MRIYSILVLCFLTTGCAKKSELDYAVNKSNALESRLNDQLSINKALQAQIHALTSGLVNASASINKANATIASLGNELSMATNALHKQSAELERYRAYFRKQKDDAAAAEGKRKEMLKQVAEANRPAEWPFRAYDVILVGLQEREGLKGEFGRFSIRNYTDEKLTGRASTGYGYSVDIEIPPNSERKDFYILAQKGSKLTITSNLGTKSYDWIVGWQ